MTIDHYILDDNNNAIPVDLMTWATWLETDRDKRRVAHTTLPDGRTVSTVFLGLNHNWMPGGDPHIFETMVFERDCYNEQYCERCSTWSQALAMHDRAVEWAIAHPDGDNDLSA